MTASIASETLIDILDRTSNGASPRPALRAVFQLEPEGLTLKWVIERERRDGEVQIIVGDLIPAMAPAGADQPEAVALAAD